MSHTSHIVSGSIISSLLLVSAAFAMDTTSGATPAASEPRDTSSVGVGMGAGKVSVSDLSMTKREGAMMKKAIDGACVASAVGVREDALITAHAAHSTAVTTALTARKTALMAAWNLTDVKARRTAREAAWATFRTARKASNATLKTSVTTAYTAFNTAAKACGVHEKEQAEMSSGVSL
jgi:hypothetical protein